MKDRRGVDVSQILRLYADGLSMAKVAFRLGVDPGTVWYHLHAQGISVRPARPPRVLEGKARLEIVDMYNRLMSTHEIAEEFRVSQAVVWNVLRAEGVPLRSRLDGLRLARSQGRAAKLKAPEGATYRASDGYVSVKMPGHAHAKSNEWALEHIVVWEEANGPLSDGWVVHHKNGVKDDNRLENLEAMSRSDHASHHQHIKIRESVEV